MGEETEKTKYPNFELCLIALKLGFPQTRRAGIKYYILPNILISIDDVSVLRADGYTDFANLFSFLVCKPDLEDVVKASDDFYQQTTKMVDGSFCVYSNVIDQALQKVINEDMEKGIRNKRTDPYIRAIGRTEWEARLKLWIEITKYNKR